MTVDEVVRRLAEAAARVPECATPGCGEPTTHVGHRCAACFSGMYEPRSGFASPNHGDVPGPPCPCSLVHRGTLPTSGSPPYVTGRALCGSPWGGRVPRAQYGSHPYACVTCPDCRAMVARFGEPAGEPVAPGARFDPGSGAEPGSAGRSSVVDPT